MLDESLRSSYLKEMGIQPWRLKSSSNKGHSSESSNFSSQINLQDSSNHQNLSIEADNIPSEQPLIPAMHESWDDLLEEINSCNKCHLCKTRNMIVPGVGDRQADWLFVGEGPGYFEDQQGEPFVGRSGKLLDNMMAAMSLKRGNNVYIANIVKCRASNAGKDRQPTEEESATCMPFLQRQIALINPKIIVALGKTAATALLGVGREVSLTSLRGTPHFFQNGANKIPLVITYHPSYLLRTPIGKEKAWSDLCDAMRLFESTDQK